HVAPDAAVQVFLAGDGGQRVGGLLVVHGGLEHAVADFLQVVVDALKRVGRVLGIGVIELEQHILGVVDQGRDAPGAHAQQTKHGQVFTVDGKQHVLVQDEGHSDVARRFVVVDQEIGADVNSAIFFIEAGRFFNVVVDDVLGQDQTETL